MTLQQRTDTRSELRLQSDILDFDQCVQSDGWIGEGGRVGIDEMLAFLGIG